MPPTPSSSSEHPSPGRSYGLESPAVAKAPPTAPVAVAPPKPKIVWPTVIGTIAVIWASLGILTSSYQIIVYSLFTFTPAISNPEMADFQANQTYYQGWAGIISLPLCIFLLVAAIYLLKRKPVAANLLRVWAVLDLISNLWGILVNMDIEYDHVGMAPAPGFFRLFMILFMVIFMGLMSAFPVFLLIWFGRDKIKAQVADWNKPSIEDD